MFGADFWHRIKMTISSSESICFGARFEPKRRGSAIDFGYLCGFRLAQSDLFEKI